MLKKGGDIMNCKKCGAALLNDAIFCTECGQKIENNDSINQKSNIPEVSKENVKKYSLKLDKFIAEYGEKNIIKFTIYAAIAFLLSIRILGFLITSIMLTLANGYLIFSKFRRNNKSDTKILLLSLLVLCIGIVCSII